jgi:hypothetical protein
MFVSGAPARREAHRFTSVAPVLTETCAERDTRLASTDNSGVARVAVHNFFFSPAQLILVCQRFAKAR